MRKDLIESNLKAPCPRFIMPVGKEYTKKPGQASKLVQVAVRDHASICWRQSKESGEESSLVFSLLNKLIHGRSNEGDQGQVYGHVIICRSSYCISRSTWLHIV